ncbi:ATP-dependent helicase [Dyadobacter sp. 32]|uniref:UvrD-helicase domain-containing protein n=1 Tax=Dyadobacter sp. 32 TaxID=538966 RepID=UPI0011EF21C3
MIIPDRWHPADNLQLEPNALIAAKEINRCLALTAGPGAGKTEMLAQRADFLLRTGSCRYPQRILAIAFKVDAASNLKDRVRRRCGPELSVRLDSHTFHAFAKRLIDLFRPVLTGTDGLDSDYSIGTNRVEKQQIRFDDLVPLAIQILKKSEVARNAVRQTYGYVFLDEFQDCTNLQYQLIKEAFHGSGIPITAVGDTKQRIMGWAGALEGIFQKFADDFGATSLNLYQNFRAKPILRRLQNSMIKIMDPSAASPESDLVGHGGIIEVIQSTNCQEEAKTIADRIDNLISNGMFASEIAVLVSRQPDLYTQMLTSVFQLRKIPFRHEQSMQDLSSEPVAQLIVDFLCVVIGQGEADAYGRLMNLLISTGIDEDLAYIERARWHRFIDNTRNNLTKPLTIKALLNLSRQFISMVGKEVLTGLSVDYQQGARMDEIINQTYHKLTELSERNPDPLTALKHFSDKNGVRIMTVHKSKGLEFDCVILLGVEQEMFWGKIDEERSAFFVGISRAKEILILTNSNSRQQPCGSTGRWKQERTIHNEFLGYVKNILK